VPLGEKANIADNLSKGTFRGTFFLAALIALDVEGIQLEGI
jgi:hypothetical protein